MKRAVCLLLAGMLCIAVSGCNRDTLAQFSAFCAAGTAYVDASHTFFQEAGSAFVDATSASLMSERANAEGTQGKDAAYRANLLREDGEARQYLATLRLIDAHAALLGKYFAAVTEIAGGKAAAGAAAEVGSLADAIAAFNPKIGSLKIGGSELESGMTPATKLVMAHFELRALNNELERHGQAIDEALALQEEAVKAIAQQMRANTAAALLGQEQSRVVAPYVAEGPLPRSWPDDRAAYLRRTAEEDHAEAAEKASRKLHTAYRTLTGSMDGKADLAGLFAAIGQMTGPTQKAR